MLTHTLDFVLTRFGFLRSKIDEVITIDILKLLKTLWIKYKGRLNPYIKKVSIAGIDSGFNYIEYRGYALYAINTVAILLSTEREEDVDGWIDIDVVTTPNIEYELSILSLCTEVEQIVKVLHKADLVLVDGSLIAMFSKLYRASIDNTSEVPQYKGIDVVSILKKLVYTLALSPRKFVFISKNSSSKDLLGLVKGDIYYLERYTDFLPGYTKPIDLVYSKHLGISTVTKLFKKYVRNLTGLDVSIGLTYLRFDEFARVYRVEVVIEPNENLDERIKYVIDMLADVVVSGYPYPLIRAHELARVRRKDIERISILLGVSKDPRDRDENLM